MTDNPSGEHPSVADARELADDRGNNSGLVGRANSRLPPESRPILDRAEIKEVQSYLEEGTEYHEINGDLRDGGRLAWAASALQNAIKKCRPFSNPITVRRGIQIDDLDSLIESLQSGEFTDPGFMSASTTASFLGNVQLQIKAWRGLDASFYGTNQGELLLPAGSNFKVVKYKRDRNKLSVELEQLQ